jgi:translocation and assembly module TamB
MEPLRPDSPDVPPRNEAGAGQLPTLEPVTTPPRRSVLGWIGRALGWTVVGIGVVLALGLLWLQTPFGAERTLNYLAEQFNPYENATLEVERVSGNWISNLSLYGLTLTRESDGSDMARIDSLELSYNLLAIPKGRLHLRDALLAGAALDIREGADQAFDIALPFLPDTLAAADTTKGRGLIIQVDEAEIRRTRAAVTFYTPPPQPDSTLLLSDVTLSARDFLLDEELVFHADTLALAYQLPRDQGRGQLRGGASLQDNLLALRSLHLTSTLSDVFASGTVRLPDVGGADADDGDEDASVLRDLDLTVRAEPLAFQDLRLFLPDLDPSRSVTLSADVQGDLGELIVNAEGRLSDGAAFGVEGVVAPPNQGDEVAFLLSGRVQRFDLGFFGPADAPSPGVVSATFETDLTGSSLQTLDGTAEARLTDTRLGEFALDRTRLDVRADDGTFRLNLRTGTRGASLSARGTVRPFDERIAYDLAGSFADLNLAAFTDSTQSSDLNGTFRVEGSGIDLETVRADLALNLTDARVNRYTILSADLDLDVRGPNVSGLVAAALPEGSLRADLSANLGGEQPSYRITDGVLTGLDVAALIGDTTRSIVNARFTASGVGLDPQTLRLDADVRLDDTVWGTYVIQTADIDASVRRGRVDADIDADLEGGSFDLALVANPFAEPLTYRIDGGTFTNVNLARLTGNPRLASDLTGTITASGTGFDPETLVLDGRVTLADSRFNNQQIDLADGTISASGGIFDYNLGLSTPEGQTRLAGTASLTGGELALELRESTFAGLDLGALLNLDVSTNLNGSGTLVVRGTDPQTMTLVADLELNRSRINGSIVPVGSVDATLIDGLLDAEVRLGLVDGVIAVNAEGRFFDERPTYRADGIVSNVNVTELAGLDSIDAAVDLRFDVEGEGLDPETMRASLVVAGDTSRYESIDVYGIDARARIGGGVVDVAALTLESNIADVAGEGRIALFDTVRAISDFKLAGQLKSVDPLRPFLPDVPLAAETGQITARISGPRQSLLVEVDGGIESAVYDSYRLGGLTGSAQATFGADFDVQSASADLDIGFLSLPLLDNIRRTDVVARYDGDEIAFEIQAARDDRRDARLAGRLDLRPGQEQVTLDTLNLRFDDERFRLLLPATLSYADGYRISNFLLVSDDQQIAIDGVVDPNGEQNLVATFDGLRLDGFTDLIGYGDVGGTLDGFVDLTGPAFAPRLTGALDLDLFSRGRAVGTLALEVGYDDLRLNLDAGLTHADGSTLSLTGYAPVDLRLATADPVQADEAPRPEGVRVQAAAGPDEGGVNFAVRADSFSVGWISPFLPERVITDFGGKLDAQATVRGTLDDPILSGDATLVDGRIGLVSTGIEYRDIDADLELAGNAINVRQLTARSGGGGLSATGQLQFERLTVGELELTAEANDFLAIDNEQYRFVADADLVIGGTTQEPVVVGEARVISGDIYLGAGDQFETIALTDADILNVESTFGIRVEDADTTTSRILDRTTLNVAIDLERDTWIRKQTGEPRIDIQFFGDIRAVKEPGGENQLFGDVEVVPDRSNIAFLGRRFQIRNGRLYFNGPILETLLDLNAEFIVYRPGTRERRATVTLAVEGRLNALDRDDAISLSGDPYTETADLVSLIATGQPAGQGFGGEDAGNLALGVLASRVQGAASRGIGLDVVEIEYNGARGAQLTAGKYLTRRFYASYSQPLTLGGEGEEPNSGSAQQPTLTIEYELTDWLLARLLYDRGLFRANFQWESAF